ncbi:MAG: transmembrane anchor protein [Acidobacteriota bacterium]|nr:transmembrane anchor protein [Acidobacteriota bacterium]
MHDISDSTPTNLPTTRQLIRSTIIAVVIAAAILIAVVLPAEYGVDPTGIGSALGLTEMGRIKVSLAREIERAENAPHTPPALTAAPAATAETTTAVAAPAAAPAPRSDDATITLQPNQGREIKLAMREGARVTFSWSTDKGVVNFDEHADSENPPRDYHGYRKGTAVAKDEGVLTAAFEGWHGWYWRNRGKETLTVTLRTSGDYQDIKELK